MTRRSMLGVLVLGAGFLFCLVDVISRSIRSDGAISLSDRRIIHLVHMRLEPGYREALQHVIDQYNALPHVLKADVEVRQSAVPMLAYAQYLNVHIVSGTAPDLCEKPQALRIFGEEFIARYFEPLGEWVIQPNPYNQGSFLPDGLDPELAQALSQSSWRDTFLDGMQSGWDTRNQDYYAIPTGFWGHTRLFFNMKFCAQAKDLIRRDLGLQPLPIWLNHVVNEMAFVRDSSALRNWLSDDAPPQTLGQLIVFCHAVRQIARETGDHTLVPIAGGREAVAAFDAYYRVPFTCSYVTILQSSLAGGISHAQTYGGWKNGKWSFEDPQVFGYYECLRILCEQFPPGFMSVDRDQAIRRFVTGKAAVVAAGGGDANIIFRTADPSAGDGSSLSGGRGFAVRVTNLPLPGSDERWSDFVGEKASEAAFAAGAPYSVYQGGRHGEWAVDFLQFLTSFRINEEFNRSAQWLPCIIGTSPAPHLEPFMPDPKGLYRYNGLRFEVPGAHIWDIYRGQLWLYLSGSINYATFADRVEAAMADPRTGVARVFHSYWMSEVDVHRSQDRMLAVQRVRLLMLDEPDMPIKYRRGLMWSVQDGYGQGVRRLWDKMFDGEPFPDF